MSTPRPSRPSDVAAILTAASAATAVLVLPSGRASAQAEMQPGERSARYVVEGYAARSWIDNQIGAGSVRLGGFGVRVVGARDERRGSRTLADRTVGGAFATYTPKQGSPNVTTLHAGLESDVSLLARPLGGRLDPFFALALGLFRTSRESSLTTPGSRGRISRTDFAFTPAVGTRIPLVAGVGLRGDLRTPIIVGASTTFNFVAEGGLHVTF